ncbi:hypothetical protein PoB_007270400 [Plakobranchus ocellatus]|uniref:Uncharacterized protein n=1 Tax=Plakobranchus ocellatus TaxID=259542 RepID=A0AAV4DQC7_9GAST|nr:hypothetical protein PoB_007270400 [Plakobranchus ocellatus]
MALPEYNIAASSKTQDEKFFYQLLPIACVFVIATLSGAACGWLTQRKGRNQISAAPPREVLVMAAGGGRKGCVLMSKYPERSVYSPGDAWSVTNGHTILEVTNTTLPSILVTPPSPPKSDISIGSCGDLLIIEDNSGERDKENHIWSSFDRSVLSSDEEGGELCEDVPGGNLVGGRKFDVCGTTGNEHGVLSKNIKGEKSIQKYEVFKSQIPAVLDTRSEQITTCLSIESDNSGCSLTQEIRKENKMNCVEVSASGTKLNQNGVEMKEDDGKASIGDRKSAICDSNGMGNASISNSCSSMGSNSNIINDNESRRKINNNKSNNKNSDNIMPQNQDKENTRTVSDGEIRAVPEVRFSLDLVSQPKNHFPDYTDVFPVDEIPLAEPNTERKVYVRSNTFPVKSFRSGHHGVNGHLAVSGLSASSGFLHPNAALHRQPRFSQCHTTHSYISPNQHHRFSYNHDHHQQTGSKYMHTLFSHQESTDLCESSPESSQPTSPSQHRPNDDHDHHNHYHSTPHLPPPPGDSSTILATLTESSQLSISTNDTKTQTASASSTYLEDEDDDFDLQQYSPRPRLSSLEPGTRKTDFKFKRPKKS